MAENNDLVWNLEAFKQRQRAQDFVMGFENKISVYSGSVSQLYTNYNIFFPKEENRKLVILPNPYAQHDNFNGLPESAVKPTGLCIVPGESDAQGRSQLFLVIPFRGGTTRFRRVPLQVGLRVINQQRPDNKPLLPVLVKGDLRELDARTPCLHLHALQLSGLDQLSQLELNDIRRVIVDRLAELS
jgi:hypothetical protein